MKNLLKNVLIGTFALALSTNGLVTNALGIGFEPGVVIESQSTTTSTSANDTINPDKNEKLYINYCINVPAYVTVGIYKVEESNQLKKVNILKDYKVEEGGCYVDVWNGKNGKDSEIGNEGTIVEEGQYYYGINIYGIPGVSSQEDYKAGWITVDRGVTQPPVPAPDNDEEDIKILDVDVENRIFNPWDDEEAEIKFIINNDAEVTLEIYDEDDDKVVTLVNEKWYEKGENEIEWDGEDRYGDIVDEGEYEFKLKAEKNEESDSETGTLVVEDEYDDDDDDDYTEDPRLKDVYVTKESFDPGRNEKTYIVFTLTAEADLSINIYDEDDNRIVKLVEEEDLEEGTYAVKWDGEDVIDNEGTYKYKIEAENRKGKDMESGEIEVEEDEKENRKPNIYKDNAEPIPFKPKNKNLSISFKLDKEADVTIEIRDGDKVLAEVIEDKEMDEGYNEVNWDGRDKYGEFLEDGIYQYKIIAENNKGKDVERGNFSIEDSSEAKNFTGCADYIDVSLGYKYCDALVWAKQEGVFVGYYDGSFQPDRAISRVEALKVILETMKVNTLGAYGDYLGFPDIDRFGWYMPYLKTALSLGIVNGYPDGTFRPNDPVNRVEALVMMLNTAKVKYGTIVPTANYGQPYYDTPNQSDTKWYIDYTWYARNNHLTDNYSYFYPNSYMTRGDMAYMLYKFCQAELE